MLRLCIAFAVPTASVTGSARDTGFFGSSQGFEIQPEVDLFCHLADGVRVLLQVQDNAIPSESSAGSRHMTRNQTRSALKGLESADERAVALVGGRAEAVVGRHLSSDIPDTLGRVELGGVGWQRQANEGDALPA
jgi:hypothetical protein